RPTCERRGHVSKPRRRATGVTHSPGLSRPRRFSFRAHRQERGSPQPVFAPPMHALRWPGAARFMKVRRCSGGCAIYMPRHNTPLSPDGITSPPARLLSRSFGNSTTSGSLPPSDDNVSQKGSFNMNDLTPSQRGMLDAWQQHTYAEFVLKDADAALATMTENPYVLAIPCGIGATGRIGVREFYANHFLPKIPPDLELTSLWQTFSDDRLVEEMVMRFTHSIAMDWMLPGLPATG